MIAMRITTAATLTVLAVLVASMPAADARYRHGHGFKHHGLGLHAGRGAHAGAGGAHSRHGNGTYVNAATEEENKLLDTKIKNICRGC